MTDLRLRLMLVAAPSRAAMQAALLGYQIMAPRLTRTTATIETEPLSQTRSATVTLAPMEMILR